MTLWKESLLRFHRKWGESAIFSALMFALCTLLFITIAFVQLFFRSGESLYAGIERSISLEGNVTKPIGYDYSEKIYQDIQDIEQAWKKFESMPGISGTSMHYALLATLESSVKTDAADDKVSLVGFASSDQKEIELSQGKKLTNTDFSNGSAVALVPTDFKVPSEKGSHPVKAGETIVVTFPDPVAAYFREAEATKATPHRLAIKVVGTFLPLKKEGDLPTDSNKTIFLPNAFVRDQMDHLYRERNKRIASSPKDAALLRNDDGVIYGAKILKPTLQCADSKTLKSMRSEVQQLAYRLDKYDEKGELVAEYKATSTFDQALKLEKAIRTSQQFVFLFMVALSVLLLVVFMVLFFYFLQSRAPEMQLRFALGSALAPMRRLFFLEKAWILCLSCPIAWATGTLVSRTMARILAQRVLSQENVAILLAERTHEQQMLWRASVQENYHIDFSWQVGVFVFVLLLFLLWALTAYALHRITKEKKRRKA